MGPVPSAHGALRRRPARDDVGGGELLSPPLSGAGRERPSRTGDCTGPVALTVSTHLALNARNCWVQEMVRAFYFGWYDRFVTKLPPLLKGEVTIPDGPGLGLQLQPDVAKRPGASLRRTTAMDL